MAKDKSVSKLKSALKSVGINKSTSQIKSAAKSVSSGGGSPVPVVTPAPVVTPTMSNYDLGTKLAVDAKGGRMPVVERYTPPAPTAPTGPLAGGSSMSVDDFKKKLQELGIAKADAPVVPEVPTEEENVFDYERYQKNLEDSQAQLEKDKEIRRQGLIDAITNKYAANVPGIKELGAAEMARTRSLNLRSGLIESPMGATEIGSTEKKTADALKQNEALKNDEIIKAVNELDDLYYTREQTAKEEDKASLEEHKASVKTIISNLAKNGVTFDKFKLDPDYQKLVKDGFSDAEIQATFIINTPNEDLYSEKPTMVGSTALWFNKKTGEPMTVETGVTNPDDVIVTKTDQGIFVLNKADGTYKNIGGADMPSGSKAKVSAEDSKTNTLRDKVTAIDTLISDPYLGNAVGPNAMARADIRSGITGGKQNFIAGVENLISQETLNSLINLKAQGGTLGALSDQERIMLQNTASKIGNWAMRDDAGRVTGYNASESAFKTELNRLKVLAQRAISNSVRTTTGDPLGLGVGSNDPLNLGI